MNRPPLFPAAGTFALALVLAGCVSVPTEQSFREMEHSAVADLPEVDRLTRRPARETRPTQAATLMLSDGLSMEEAVQIAMANNRRIQAEYERLDMALAHRLRARLLKNPEADGLVKVSDEDAGDKVVEVGAEVDVLHMILLPSRNRVAQAEYESVRMEVSRAVQELGYTVRKAYYALLAAQERLALQGEVQQATAAGFEMAARLREAGNIKQLELLTEQALHEQAKLAVAAEKLSVVEAREDLNILMGLWGPDATWKSVGSLPDPPETTVSAEGLEAAALEQSVQLAVQRRRIRAAARRLGMARVESALPKLHLGVEAEREPDAVWFVGPKLSLELPLFDFGQADRPAKEAALRRQYQEYAALAVEIQAAARKAAHKRSLILERVQDYRQNVLPLQEQITRRTQLQYNAMQLGVFQLLQAKQMEIMARSAYINELLNYWIAETELEQIRKGLLVESGGNTSNPPPVPSPARGGH